MMILSAIRTCHATVPAFVAVGLLWGCVAAMAPALKARIDVDDATFGLLLLGTAVGLAITLVTAPHWDKRLGRWAMPLGTVLLAAAALGPGFATTPLMFFLVLAVAGMTSGLTDVVMNARVAMIEARTGGSLMNVNHAMFSVAYAGSALVTGVLRDAGWSPEQVFLTVALATLATVPFQFMEVDPEPENEGQANRLPFKLVAICGGIVLVAFMAEATVESWSALHIERTLGGDPTQGAFGPAMLGMTMAFGRFSGQAVASRLSEEQVIRWATGVAAVGALIAGAAPVPWVAYVGFGLLGLGVSVIGPMGLAIAGRLSPKDRRTALIARVAVIGFLGFFFAPALMGLGAELFGLPMAFACVALFVSILWPLIAVVRRF